MIDTKILRSANSKLRCDLLNKDMFNVEISTNNIVRFLNDFSYLDLPAKILLNYSPTLFKGKRIITAHQWQPNILLLNDSDDRYVVPITSDMIAKPEKAAKTLLAGYKQYLADESILVHDYLPAQAAWQTTYNTSQMLFSKKEYTDWLIPKLSYLNGSGDINNNYLYDTEYVAKSILAYADTYHSLKASVLESIMALIMFRRYTKYSTIVKQLIRQILRWLNTPNFIKYSIISSPSTFAYRTLFSLCYECGIKQITLPFSAIFYLTNAPVLVSGKYKLAETFDSITFKVTDKNDLDFALAHYKNNTNITNIMKDYPNAKIDYHGYEKQIKAMLAE